MWFVAAQNEMKPVIFGGMELKFIPFHAVESYKE
jgi:hypothetical protein